MNLVNLNNISYSRRLSRPTCTQMLDSILPNVLEKRGGADKRNDKPFKNILSCFTPLSEQDNCCVRGKRFVVNIFTFLYR